MIVNCLITVLLIAVTTRVAAEIKCPASCVPIADCPSLQRTVQSMEPEQVLKFTSNISCGYHNDNLKVCCDKSASTCTTHDGKQGVCTPIFQCPYISEKLTPKRLSTITKAHVGQARKACQNGDDDDDEYRVCCGPKPTTVEKLEQECLAETPNDVSNACCGVFDPNDRILGGQVASLEDYPWMALIEYELNNGGSQLLCGGSLISTRHVLTAAHCVTGSILKLAKPISVRLGDYNTTNPDYDCPDDDEADECAPPAINVSIAAIIPHPMYEPDTKRNDIALIRLDTVVPYDYYISPVCLPSSDTVDSEITGLTAAGWGVTESGNTSEVKMKVDLRSVDLVSCQSAYATFDRSVKLWEGQMCAGGVTGQDTCNGDSGGPLMNVLINNIELVGVVSFGPAKCGVVHVPGVYTRVSYYLDWIMANAV